MRIVAGTARGRTLLAPPGLDTRPTAIRAREALFSILTPRIPGARVLDLFAGSGALGLEALSRGAQTATLVDISPKAVACMQQNATACGFSPECLRMDALCALAGFAANKQVFDLVFLDPPYRSSLLAQALAECAPLLAPGGLVVAESDRPLALDPAPSGLTASPPRRYGAVNFTFFERN